MADEFENATEEEPGGTLADAIAAHLALKKEHGADPDEVEHELEDALSPPRRDEEPEAVQLPPEPEPEPEPAPAPTPAPEAVRAPVQIPDPEPEPEPMSATPIVEDGSEADPDPVTEAEVASSVEEPKPGEITGTIEFEFGDAEEAPAEPAEAVPDHDLLEDTPDFFEETPEHDKLWFDEKPPRKFDF